MVNRGAISGGYIKNVKLIENKAVYMFLYKQKMFQGVFFFFMVTNTDPSC